jgi:hypothetical protein
LLLLQGLTYPKSRECEYSAKFVSSCAPSFPALDDLMPASGKGASFGARYSRRPAAIEEKEEEERRLQRERERERERVRERERERERKRMRERERERERGGPSHARTLACSS